MKNKKPYCRDIDDVNAEKAEKTKKRLEASRSAMTAKKELLASARNTLSNQDKITLRSAQLEQIMYSILDSLANEAKKQTKHGRGS